MKKSLLLATASLGMMGVSATYSAPASAQSIASATRPAPKAAATLSDDELRALGEGVAFPYEKLERALTPIIDKDGAVYYGKLKGDNDLATFARAVAIADMSRFPKWSNPADPKDPKSVPTPDRSPELTFYINAYNGLFFKTLSDAYPVNSPLQIKDLDTAKTHRVAGKDYSFVELRRLIAGIDPRALFALPDGTKNGPRATSAVFTYYGLNDRLTGTVQAYVNDVSKVSAPSRLQNSVEVSPWLATVDEFFAARGGRTKYNGIRAVLATYTTRDADQRYFAAGDYQVKFMEGSNAINEQLSR